MDDEETTYFDQINLIRAEHAKTRLREIPK